MSKRIRAVYLCLLVTVVAGLVLSASALASTRLLLTENGSPVARGALAQDYHLTFDGGCLQESRGEVVTNASATDKLAFGPLTESECLEEGYSVSGSLKSVKLTSAGLATLDFGPKLEIGGPGPCVYQFAKWVGQFPASIEVDIEGTGVGKLVRKPSSAACAGTETIYFDAVESGIDNDIFGAELVP
jgi:hypothetical protein